MDTQVTENKLTAVTLHFTEDQMKALEMESQIAGLPIERICEIRSTTNLLASKTA
ncbi:hypothetical protein P0Y35_05845 [Kiritimatiellaeota bacterium B1221]|nr:hypothetical protein [Kiritimatiellaeota bacterium B1221]